MAEIQLSLNVLCTDSTGIENPSYRLYIDQDLITERTFIWDRNREVIEEHLYLNLDPGMHTARAEYVHNPNNSYVFQIKNITINGDSAPDRIGTRESYFTID